MRASVPALVELFPLFLCSEGQRKTYGRPLSLPTMEVQGRNSGPQAQWQALYLLSHLTSPRAVLDGVSLEYSLSRW